MNPIPPNPALAFSAVENNDQARLMMSLAKGLDPNVLDDQGRTLLIAACQQDGDRYTFVDTFMGHGANPTIIGPNGRTALHELCEKRCQSIKTLEMLLENDITLNQADHAGQTPLHALAARGWMEGCIALLDSCPVPKGLCNQQDNKGQTPLLLAAEHGAIVCLLISYGADPRIADENAQTTLQKVSDPQARAMIIMQSKVLGTADENKAKSRLQDDPEFSDLMDSGKFVLARQLIAKSTGNNFNAAFKETKNGKDEARSASNPRP